MEKREKEENVGRKRKERDQKRKERERERKSMPQRKRCFRCQREGRDRVTCNNFFTNKWVIT